MNSKHWRAFKASVTQLNAYVHPLVLRKFQSDILNNGGFTVVSPISGEAVEVTRSISLGKRIAYFIPDSENTWLIAGYVGQGFPLSYVVTEPDGHVRAIEKVGKHPEKEIRRDEIDMLRESGAQRAKAGGKSDATLTIGNANFAHHLWNELPALEAWLRDATDERIARLTIAARYEPLGPLQQIFPRLSSAKMVTKHKKIRRILSAAPISVQVGSCLVTEQARAAVRAFSRQHADQTNSAAAHAQLENAWPRVWMSVRLGSRTADNLEHFLFSVCQEIFKSYPEAAILVDGISYPFRFFEDPRTVTRRPAFLAQTQAVDNFIAALRRRVEKYLGTAAASRLHSISGLGLVDAIELGAHCDYYICHSGTLQHKIGWMHNIPGLIHWPTPEMSHAIYHAAQVEGGVVPDILPADHVIATTSPPGRPHPQDRNYTFVDPERSAQFVVECMQSRLVRRVAPVVGRRASGGGSRRRTLFMHVGPHKTGTSAIQGYLRGHDNSVVVYPKAGLYNDGAHHNLVYKFFGENSQPSRGPANRSIESLFEKIATESMDSDRDIVISSELFESESRDVGKFIDAVMPYVSRTPVDVEIVVACREHFARVASRYNMRVRWTEGMNGEQRYLPDQFLAAHAKDMCYATLVRRFRNTGHRVAVLNYQPSATWTERFFRHIGFPEDRIPRNIEMQRIALSPKALIATIATNRAVRSMDERRRFLKAFAEMPESHRPSHFIFGREAAAAAENLFAEDRNFLREECGVEIEPPEIQSRESMFFIDAEELREIEVIAHSLGAEGPQIVQFAQTYVREGARDL